MSLPPNVRPSDSTPVVTYDVDEEESLSDAVLCAVGQLVDDLTDVRPLSSYVDIEAVDHLFESRRVENSSSHIVAFTAWDWWFVVTSDTVEVYAFSNPLD